MKETKDMTEALTDQENARLSELETTIKDGIGTFKATGAALAEIRDSKLYRSQYPTFEKYCEDIWDLGRARAYQLIEAAEVAKSLPENLSSTLDNSSKALALAKVKPAKRKAVLKKAKAKAGKGKPVTAKIINEVTTAGEAVSGKKPKAKAKSEPVVSTKPYNGGPVTLAEFKAELSMLCNRIPNDANHDKFGEVLMMESEIQMNWGTKKSKSPYTR